MWLVARVVAGGVSSSFLADALTTDVDLTNEPEAKRARELLEARLRGPEHDTEIVIVSSESATVDDPAFGRYVERLRGELTALGPEVVVGTRSYKDEGGAALVSKDRRTTLVPVVLAGPKFEASEHVPAVRQVIAENRAPGFRVLVSGLASLNEDFNTVAEEDLRTGEGFGVMAAWSSWSWCSGRWWPRSCPS